MLERIYKMLTDELKSETEKVDRLTDFDGVVIKGQSPYIQIFAYFSHLDEGHIKFIGKSVNNYRDYKKNGDISVFYEMLAGCPVEVLDKTVFKYRQNEKWIRLVEKQKVGIVSRNNHRIISKYLNLKKLEGQPTKTNIVAANKPEIKSGIYTGNVEIIVNNNNLVDFVREKEYICGREEKRILEDFGIYSIKVEDGLYICSKRKIF